MLIYIIACHSMNEMKFRGKVVDMQLPNGELLTGDFVYGSLLQGNGLCRILTAATKCFLNYRVDPETVGLFSGLIVEGKEVYPGDFLHVKAYMNGYFDCSLFTRKELITMDLSIFKAQLWKEYDCEVTYKNGAFLFGDNYMYPLFEDMRLCPTIYEVAVIGNRFDNPDLRMKIEGEKI